MAKIVKTGTQEQALRTVNSSLRTLTGVNSLLNSKGEETYGFHITAGKQRAVVLVEKSFGDGILQDIRRKLVKETKSLAKKNAIVLNADDMEILDNQYSEQKSSELKIQIQRMLHESPEGNQEIHDDSR